MKNRKTVTRIYLDHDGKVWEAKALRQGLPGALIAREIRIGEYNGTRYHDTGCWQIVPGHNPYMTSPKGARWVRIH